MGDFEKDLVASIPRLKNYARKLERNEDRAEELVQITVLAALEGKDSFKGESLLTTWLFQIMKYRRATSFQKDRRIEYGTPAYDEALGQLYVNPNQLDTMELRNVSKRIGALPPNHQEVFVGMCVLGRTTEELAQKAQVPPGTIRSRMHYARKALSDLVE